MRKFLALLSTVAALLAIAVPAGGSPTAGDARRVRATEYVVLYADGATLREARAAIEAAGGRLVRVNRAIGLAKVRSRSATFLEDVRDSDAVKGAARNHAVGTSRPGQEHKFAEERLDQERPNYPTDNDPPPGGGSGAIRDGKKKSGIEPLSARQWDMHMIGATADGSYAVQRGDPGVLVGIIDTGIDASHPDIAPNFNSALSRNFTTDIPLIDGACASDPDGSCADPATVDENGHGTHVAGTVASPINGVGIAGVAPDVTLVNLRAGQDSGYFFLEETVSALTYAGDNGVDVVNMSFYVDPWLYNCPTAADQDPAPTAEELEEQQTILAAMTEALEYAHAHGVTLVGAAGNGHEDLGANSKVDRTSPDYPPGTEYTRTVTDNCLDLPTEGPHVISVSSIGPSTTKADYSNYGNVDPSDGEEITVAAPGGWFRDFYGTNDFRQPENMILAPYPEIVGREFGEITPGGGSNTRFVVRDCDDGNDCSYYQYIQGTSMAAPHAAGVAALIVSEYGSDDGNGGLTMAPDDVAAILTATATEHACPDPATEDYTQEGRPASWNATCVGSAEYNGFYGYGIVDALRAVSVPS